jgi:hypothetical protein
MSRGWWSLTWAAQNRVKYLVFTCSSSLEYCRMSRRIGLKGTMSRDFLRRRLTDEVVPVFVVELGGDGDDSTEEVGHETQMFHLGLPLNIVLPQAVTPEQKMQED